MFRSMKSLQIRVAAQICLIALKIYFVAVMNLLFNENLFCCVDEDLSNEIRVAMVFDSYVDIDGVENRACDDDIYISLYGYSTFVLYDEDVEPPDRELRGNCFLQILRQDGITSEDVHVVSYMTNQKVADTRMCSSIMEFLNWAFEQEDLITISYSRQCEVYDGDVYIVDSIKLFLTIEAFDTNNKRMVDLCVESSIIMILFSRELVGKYYKTSNSMRILLNMSKAIIQETCEGRKVCQRFVRPSTAYLYVRHLQYSRCAISLFKHKYTTYALSLKIDMRDADHSRSNLHHFVFDHNQILSILRLEIPPLPLPVVIGFFDVVLIFGAVSDIQRSRIHQFLVLFLHVSVDKGKYEFSGKRNSLLNGGISYVGLSRNIVNVQAVSSTCLMDNSKNNNERFCNSWSCVRCVVFTPSPFICFHES